MTGSANFASILSFHVCLVFRVRCPNVFGPVFEEANHASSFFLAPTCLGNGVESRFREHKSPLLPLIKSLSAHSGCSVFYPPAFSDRFIRLQRATGAMVLNSRNKETEGVENKIRGRRESLEWFANQEIPDDLKLQQLTGTGMARFDERLERYANANL